MKRWSEVDIESAIIMSDLPNLVLVQAKMHNVEEGGHIKYLLFEVTRQPHLEKVPDVKIWKWNTINSPRYMLSSGVWHSDGIQGSSESYFHYRQSQLDETKYYENKIKKTNRYISLPGIGNIHVYMMTKPNTILPSHYYYVCAGSDDIEKKWHIRVAAAVKEEVRDTHEAMTYKIPTHIFRSFVDSSIQNGEECPITMEKITRETVALTQCGHLFQKTAILKALEQYQTCPTCRSACLKTQIQTW